MNSCLILWYQGGRDRRGVRISSASQSGNKPHLAPEVLTALRRLQDSGEASALVDFSGQASFEAGVLLFELATGAHPLGPSYPKWVTPSSGTLAVEYSDGMLDSSLKAGAAALKRTGYPGWVMELMRQLLAPVASSRLPLDSAKAQVDIPSAPVFTVDREVDVVKPVRAVLCGGDLLLSLSLPCAGHHWWEALTRYSSHPSRLPCSRGPCADFAGQWCPLRPASLVLVLLTCLLLADALVSTLCWNGYLEPHD